MRILLLVVATMYVLNAKIYLLCIWII